jgi:hypothetical protein
MVGLFFFFFTEKVVKQKVGTIVANKFQEGVKFKKRIHIYIL